MITVNGKEVFVEYFLSGEQRIVFPYKPINLFPVSSFHIVWKYDKDEELMTLYYIKRKLEHDYGANVPIHLDIPYFPNSRMDRVQYEEDVFTLKYFSELLNFMKFETINTSNPHSDVCMALVDNIFQNNYDKDRIERVISKIEQEHKIDILMYPDNGCVKKYEALFSRPYLVGHKRRDWATGQIEGLEILGSVPDEPFNVLIVDDICSRGGTFLHTARKLKKLGADKIFLYVTHCEDSIYQGELLYSRLIEKIYTTDSILRQRNSLIKVVK